MNIDNVLDDIFNTALCIVSRGVLGNGRFTELQGGIKKLKSYIHGSYKIEDAILHASYAAYLSKLIRNKAVSFQKYRLPEDVKDVMIEDPSIIKLNRLKKVNPEAFYYWYLISRMQVQDDED